MTAGSNLPTGVPLERDHAMTAAARASAAPANVWWLPWPVISTPSDW
jgi:hypothetical protein